jgi:asparagine synthase (glutamine-hydrolysing)
VSAIVGIYNLDGRPVGHDALQTMNSILAHRGPDGGAVWCDGAIGLGHRMLHTTSESLREALPFVNPAADLVITADARIDNREELIEALDLTNRTAEEMADSQFILAAYQKWGERCPERLLGSFAFAIWDGRRRSLFCARDHVGTKTFYYFQSDGTFIFASEIKALLSHVEVPRKLNEVRVAEYLASIFEDRTNTFYAGILRLAPAHSLAISPERVQLRPFWSLDPERELRLGSDDAYAEAFRELFTKAVGCSMRSAFPVASSLSGGLDSSSVSCVARQWLAQRGALPLRTFSIVFDELVECDERRFINKVLASGGFEPHYITADRLGPLENIESMLWHQDEAFYAPGLFSTWELFRAARDQGVRILLDGHDGDGIVSHGFGRLNELAETGQWQALTVEARGLAKVYGNSITKILWGYLRRYKLDPFFSRQRGLQRLQGVSRALLQRVRFDQSQPDPSSWKALVNPEFARRIGLAERYRSWSRGQPGGIQRERQMHYRTLLSGLQPFALEVFDKAAAAFSIELRHPFWDKRLVEFCLALPSEQKLFGGWGRVVMRRAMANILPSEIQWRVSKTDFLPSFSHGWLVHEREQLDSVVHGNLEIIKDYVDVIALSRLHDRVMRQRSRGKLEEVLALWRVVSLVLWLRSVGEKGGAHENP